MPKPWMPSEQDRVILQDLINVRKRQLQNTPSRPPTERSWDETEDHQAPEVYVAKPQTSAGIPALLEASIGVGTGSPIGTGTLDSGSTYDEPGKAECDIYQILVDGTSGDPELHPVTEFSHIVHNITKSALSQDWVQIHRTKYGKWLALPGPPGLQMFELLESLNQFSGDIVLAARKFWNPSADSGNGGYIVDCDDTFYVADYNEVGHTAGAGGFGTAEMHVRDNAPTEVGVILDLCCPGDEQGSCP